jgi:hypothetical protein
MPAERSLGQSGLVGHEIMQRSLPHGAESRQTKENRRFSLIPAFSDGHPMAMESS